MDVMNLVRDVCDDCCVLVAAYCTAHVNSLARCFVTVVARLNIWPMYKNLVLIFQPEGLVASRLSTSLTIQNRHHCDGPLGMRCEMCSSIARRAENLWQAQNEQNHNSFTDVDPAGGYNDNCAIVEDFPVEQIVRTALRTLRHVILRLRVSESRCNV